MPFPDPQRCLTVLAMLALAVAAAGAERAIDFNRDIRPLLAENCFHCHGQDIPHRKAKLRLDDSAEARRDHGGHAAIVPGKPQASELVARITTHDPDDQMPPPDSNRRLNAEQIALLTRWIAEGAVYQDHWAFTPPRRPAVPTTHDRGWPRGAVDCFIAERLDAEGLAPAPAAAPEAWLRRASLDLTGLPPTPAELDAFRADIAARGEAAWEAAADRLLAAPAYGERMAQDWLDVARYADTHGFNNDSARSMWRWRDWVIAAFNANLPYDRFITEQLAGDLLPRPTLDQRIATGFARNHVINSEGGIIAEEYRVEYVADRVRTLGMAWLGLTVECARCHDHKFDPIPQRDYYRLFAFFNNLDEYGEDGRVANASPIMPAPTAKQQDELAVLAAAIAVEDAAIAARSTGSAEVSGKDLAALVSDAEPPGVDQPAVELAVRTCAAELYNVANPAAGVSGATVRIECDALLGPVLPGDAANGIELADGQIDLGKPWSFAAWVRWNGGEGPLFSTMNYRIDPSSGDYGKGNEVRITAAGRVEIRRADTWPHYSIQAVAREALDAGAWQHVVVTCGGGSKASGLRVFVDGRERGCDVLHDDLNGKPGGRPRLGADSATPPARQPGELAGVRFYQRALDPQAIAAWSEGWLARLLVRDGAAAGQPRARWAHEWQLRHGDKEFMAHYQKREDLRGQRLALERELPSTMVMAEMTVPRQAHVLTRGQYDAPAAAVEAGVPEALHTPWPEGAPRNRLGLAQWLCRSDHPTTARVVVNRFWAQLFGTGLVKTVEDLGRQGEYPSHPELLDWLASEFVAGGWNVKALLRTLVLSATYRQNTAGSAAGRERDAENRLLSRGPRLRLSAEMIRDQALAVSGLLRQRLGGPSVFPLQPADLYKGIVVDAPYPGTSWVASTGDDLHRRSLYTFWKRTVPHPVMSVLDVPDREVCTARRSRTNTPLQALTLMNEAGFVEAARALGERMLREGGGDDAARIGYAFRLATARHAEAKELAILQRLLARLRDDYHADPAAAHLLLGAAPTPADEPELAAHAALAGVILNLDETVTKN